MYVSNIVSKMFMKNDGDRYDGKSKIFGCSEGKNGNSSSLDLN
jgi:hypothetical protein